MAELSGNRKRRFVSDRLRAVTYLRRQGGSPGLLGVPFE